MFYIRAGRFPSHARELGACLATPRPPDTRVMASPPMRKLRKTGAVDQDGNVVTNPAPAGCHGYTKAARLEPVEPSREG